MKVRTKEMAQKAFALVLAALLALMMTFVLVACDKKEEPPATDPAQATEQPKQDEPVYSNTVETPVEPLDEPAGEPAGEPTEKAPAE
jgi:cell division protein FtsN